jgi:restriction endonuclease S subunit
MVIFKTPLLHNLQIHLNHWLALLCYQDFDKLSAQIKTKIVIPPLLEQKAIAQILTAFDDKIELLQARNYWNIKSFYCFIS